MNSIQHGSREVFERISERLGDVVLISSLLLRGEIIFSGNIFSLKGLEETLRDNCGSRLCYVHVRMYNIENSEIGELRAIVYNGVMLGAYSLFGGRDYKGIVVIEKILEDSLSRIHYMKTVIYGFMLEVLPKEDAELIREAIEMVSAKHKAVETGKPSIQRLEEKAPTNKPEEVVASKLRKLGVPVINVALAIGKDQAVIDIICDEEREIPDPENMVLPVLRLFIEQFNEIVRRIRRVKIAIHHSKIYVKQFDLRRDIEVMRILGYIPEILSRVGLYIDKYKYRLINDTLELSIILKRSNLYSNASIQEVVKMIYDGIKDKWRGKLIVKARIGRWGLEAKYP